MKNIMIKILKKCLIITCLSIFLFGCSPTDSQQVQNSVPTPISTSANQNQVDANSPPEDSIVNANKVVALTSLSADIIYRLAPDKLVAIPGSRLLRQDKRFQDLPKVSEGRTPPNLEKIVALKPDLVIGANGFHDRTLNKLKELGIATQITEIDSWESLIATTKLLAKSIEANPDSLLKKYDTFLDNIPTSETRALVLVSNQPVLSPNKDSWTGDLLSKLKIKNITEKIQGKSANRGYITLSEEKILQENPEAILVVDPANRGVLKEFQSKSFWKELEATKNEKVYSFDYYGLVNPGSIDKIEETCKRIKDIFG
ncbi:MAG: ABC transporter substrate-binding protein [Cyanobacteria bacterium P01_A01_bin.45]